MPRLTTRVFADLAVWMTGLGLAIGLIFPPFCLLLGLPASGVITPTFFASTLAAGLVVPGHWESARPAGNTAARRGVGCWVPRANPGRRLRGAPVPPLRCDAVVMETTYGDRRHRDLAASVEELYAAIADTFARGGNVVIPSFAVERAQEVLFHLGRIVRAL